MKKIFVVIQLFIVALAYAGSLFDEKLQNPKPNDIVGSWRAESIIYFSKLRSTDISRQKLIYHFTEDGLGKISMGKTEYKLGWFVSKKDKKLYIKQKEHIVKDKKANKISYFPLKDIVLGATTTTIDSSFDDAPESYFFNIIKQDRMGSATSIVILDRIDEKTKSKSSKGALLRTASYDYKNIVRYLRGKRVLIYKGRSQSTHLVEPVEQVVKKVRKKVRKKVQSKLRKQIEIPKKLPKIIINKRDKEFEILNTIR